MKTTKIVPLLNNPQNAQLVERMIAEARRRQEIEAENEQRARELEEARQLQLSMLPKDVPQLPHVEIAALIVIKLLKT